MKPWFSSIVGIEPKQSDARWVAPRRDEPEMSDRACSTCGHIKCSCPAWETAMAMEGFRVLSSPYAKLGEAVYLNTPPGYMVHHPADGAYLEAMERKVTKIMNENSRRLEATLLGVKQCCFCGGFGVHRCSGGSARKRNPGSLDTESLSVRRDSMVDADCYNDTEWYKT